MSWLTLLLATGGVVLAVVAVASIVLGEVNRATASAAVAAVTAVACLIFMAPQIHAVLSFLNTQRLMYRGLPAEKAREKCLVDGGNAAQAGFLEFVRRTVPAHTRDVWVGGFPVDAACVSFVLLPRLLEAGPQSATWAIFTSGMPPNWADMIVPGSVRKFGSAQLVARLRR